MRFTIGGCALKALRNQVPANGSTNHSEAVAGARPTRRLAEPGTGGCGDRHQFLISQREGAPGRETYLACHYICP